MNKTLKKSTGKTRTPSKSKQKPEKPKTNKTAISEINTTIPAVTTLTENKVKSPKPKPSTPPITNPSTSRQTSILLPNVIENVESETKTRNMQYKQTATTVLSQEEKEINEALQAIVQSRGASPIAKHVTNPKTGKSLVKIISPGQGGKSLIIPSTGAQLLKQTQETKSAKAQVITQQLLQTLNAQQKLLPKTNESEIKKVPVTVQQQILKNVTLLRSIPQSQANSPTTTNIILEDSEATQEQVQGVTHSLKPKQQQMIVKQKTVQMQKQTSLLGQQQQNISGKAVMSSGQTPMVAKVLTNAAGQVISVGSLLAQHQKQGKCTTSLLIVATAICTKSIFKKCCIP